MIARHTLTYVGSRGVAAALNMASLAVFTRLAPAEAYGGYLLILSWALVLYGATCQWPKFSFFALYEEARAADQIGTVIRLLAAMIGLAGLAAALGAWLGIVAPPAAGAILAAVIGMMVFEGACEIARTRLEAGAVAMAIVLRAVLVLGLGIGVLLWTGRAVDLLLATALANILAALPPLRAIGVLLCGRGSWTEARRLLTYGWPLILSFAAAALAQTIDRLIIGQSVGVAELGAYGAFSDFLRQSFVVFGDSIALALVSIAKREARVGGMEAARPVLEGAARLLAVIAAFGGVFFLAFDDLVVTVLLGPDYRTAALTVAPMLIAASIFLMLRSYYFGQIIYFSASSRLDAVASLTLLVAIAGLSAILIPPYGIAGAAAAVVLGQALACLVFMIGDRTGIRMPVPWRDVAEIGATALGCWIVVIAIEASTAGRTAPTVILELVVLLCGIGAMAWRFDILGVASMVRRRRMA
ncbi:lipopolysaccharide biosynthesis protein [Methylobacterium gossipiicola]|uniref:Membrane protein involved in the export of O-antigen and teichoic acid n=1 Tax=Methylobacterium gossipiicola TaxID=582675 RepID=A0A1I2W9I5_9HYPH|nr:polysaccharide biosynthesis C-terminal domain-containing protein [Methylobacterium gossipiicola]SFG98118.1 Membrane protein involved in the export of O-antigen and teichoic acid [Methylobacterium gossipiicola]